MSKLNKNQSGFGTVEGILILVILVLIGVVGWMVYKDHNKTVANTTPATITSQQRTFTASVTKTEEDKVNTGVLSVHVQLKNTGKDNLTFNIADFTLATTTGTLKKFDNDPNKDSNFQEGNFTLLAGGTGDVILSFEGTPKSSAKTLIIDSATGGKQEVPVQ